MAIKVLISDVDLNHARSISSNIINYCPTAIVNIRIESIDSSVTWAISNGYNLIVRATTSLSDYRNQNAGKNAWDGGRIGIIHALGSNSNVYDPDPTFRNQYISAVSYGSATANATGSYGPGLEYYTNSPNQSNATPSVGGMIAQLMTLNNAYSFFDARQILRDTATLSANPTNAGGYGLIRWSSASALASISANPSVSLSALVITSATASISEVITPINYWQILPSTPSIPIEGGAKINRIQVSTAYQEDDDVAFNSQINILNVGIASNQQDIYNLSASISSLTGGSGTSSINYTILDSYYASLSANQSISGDKIFINNISLCASPSSSNHLITLGYLDSVSSSFISLTGISYSELNSMYVSLTANNNIFGNKLFINNVTLTASASSAKHAVNKEYADNISIAMAIALG